MTTPLAMLQSRGMHMSYRRYIVQRLLRGPFNVSLSIWSQLVWARTRLRRLRRLEFHHRSACCQLRRAVIGYACASLPTRLDAPAIVHSLVGPEMPTARN